MTLQRRRTRAKRTAWGALALIMPLLGGCGSGAYVDSRREAGLLEPVGTSTPDMVAICYSKTAQAAADVKTLAESECAKTGRVPQFSREDRWGCTLSTPRRVFYRCAPK
jgi:hypothetical protein